MSVVFNEVRYHGVLRIVVAAGAVTRRPPLGNNTPYSARRSSKALIKGLSAGGMG